ncbi:Uncharacterized protein DBV15_02549 [Temnothorax longispinosus]|uniref:Uncharacterized protein n=1 Tax=Temnothorax longispinosus TaxID=300112 RepID=A0A4S2KSD6_9HYME|nr:Uncharacterized protein DBV15_02549 [Temnothorax longispinosus]
MRKQREPGDKAIDNHVFPVSFSEKQNDDRQFRSRRGYIAHEGTKYDAVKGPRVKATSDQAVLGSAPPTSGRRKKK